MPLGALGGILAGTAGSAGAAATTGAWTALGAGAMAGASVYGAKKQAGAAKRAGEYTAASTDAALQHEIEQDRLEREQYQREYERNILLEDEERRLRDEDRALELERYQTNQARLDADRAWDERLYGEQQTRLLPYQEAGAGALRSLTSMLDTAPKIPVGRGTRRITALI